MAEAHPAGMTRKSKVRGANPGSLMTQVTVRAGTLLACEGAAARECYLVKQGTVDVIRDGVRVAEIGPGEWAGEMALLGGVLRNATLRTRTDVVLHVLHAGEFASLLGDFPELASEVQAVAAVRRPAVRVVPVIA